MKKKGSLFILVTLLMSFVLTACGTPMYELTQEEEELIAQYAAYTLAKHNLYQKDGVKSIDPSLLNQVTTDEMDVPEVAPEDEADEVVLLDGEAGDGMSLDVGESISLATAMGHEELEVTYQGFMLTDSYKEGRHYAVSANPGNSFVVMQFQVSNPTDADVSVDMLAENKTFRACPDGSSWVNEDVTLLLYDFSSYKGTISAGEQVDMVLLFQTKTEKAELIKGVSLSVSSDGTIKSVIL